MKSVCWFGNVLIILAARNLEIERDRAQPAENRCGTQVRTTKENIALNIPCSGAEESWRSLSSDYYHPTGNVMREIK